MTHLLDFIPLIVFVWFARLAGIEVAGPAWKNAFYIGAAVACAQMFFYWYKRLSYDFIALGSNLFLIYGAVGFLLYQPFLKAFLNESIIFAFILLVGLITTFTIRGGFIQLPKIKKNSALIGSFALLGLTLVVLIISYVLVRFLHAGTIVGVAIPFAALMFGRKALRDYFSEQR